MVNRLDPPKSTVNEQAIESARGMVKAAIGLMFPGGSLFGVILDLLYRRPIEARTEKWMTSVADAIQQLQESAAKLTPEKLSENEEFITLLHKATDVALKTHEEEKLKLLRNAIVNSATTALELDKKALFIRLIDELSINQILVLNLFDDPLAWLKKHGIQPTSYTSALPTEVIGHAFPDLYNHPDLKELILIGLENRGLLSAMTNVHTGEALWARHTTQIGREFLKFVEAEDLKSG